MIALVVHRSFQSSITSQAKEIVLSSIMIETCDGTVCVIDHLGPLIDTTEASTFTVTHCGIVIAFFHTLDIIIVQYKE